MKDAAMTDFRHLSLEPGRDPARGCPCCDPDACFPQGYVLRSGVPHAVYFADWEHGAPGYVEILISVGDWSEDSSPGDRTALALRGRMTKEGVTWHSMDGHLSLWQSVPFIGSFLGSQDHSETQEFLEIADFLATADHRVEEALGRTREVSTRTLRPHIKLDGIASAVGPTQEWQTAEPE